ncbi:MAG: VWA domain-containing protein [Deltaproteobacteria bacterium]|nr:VWA domain-containing protein [Deltaproteobacteria bacterium]
MKLYPCIAFALILAVSCRTDRKQKQQTPESTGGALVQPDKHPSDSPGTQETPPHVFTPRSHEPRQHYMPPRPNMSAMPKLVTRFDACSPRWKGRRTRPKPKPPTYAPNQIASGSFAVARGSRGKRDLARDTVRPGASKKKIAGPSAPSPAPSPAQPAEATKTTAASQAKARARRSPKKKKLEIADREESNRATEIASREKPRIDYEDWGAAIYLSNDDTMSLSSAQRVMYAIDKFLPLPLEHIRPHELLNYFSFETGSVAQGNDFSVLADIEADPRQHGVYSLAMSVKGRPLDVRTRRNAVVTFVVDRSGSMRDEGRMDYLKRGLKKMIDELKTGDMVHLVGFDQNVCVPLENFVVGRDSRRVLEQAVDSIKLGGSTNLHAGLSRGYEIADQTYRPEYSNRVVMITDALANTGVTDAFMMSMISRYYDTRRIRLSGIGVGRKFNDALLDRLTEKGKGAYVFLGSEAEVDAVFGSRFISLIETSANNVRFRLHLPPSLRMNVFYGEESSTVKEDVQQIHYFANTSQLFLSDLMARNGKLRLADSLMMSIEYQDPETSQEFVEEYAFNLGELERASYNVRKARVAMAWIDLLAMMAARPSGLFQSTIGGWVDAEGWSKCEEGRGEIAGLAEGIERDAEVKRVLDLWNKFCSRYERPRNPVRRQIGRQPIRRRAVQPSDSWPGAQPTQP